MITLAIVNARVWTGNPRQPWASGIAVDGDKVIAVASSAEVAKLVVSSTRVIDAKGKPTRNPGGTIVRGGPADFIIADDDSHALDLDAGHLQIIARIVAGKIVFERDEQ